MHGFVRRGKVGSALTVAAAGTVSTAVNSLEATPFWWVNAASGVTTGKSLGTHARAVTEGLIGSVTGAMGVKPQVLQSYPAGIGSISSGASVSQPGRFASQISAERGRNAQDDYSNYMNGEGGVHVNELGSAYGRGAA